MRLLVRSVPLAGGLIGAGCKITWPRPTKPGDVLRVVSTVVDISPSKSKPDRGIVTVQSDTLNQRGKRACHPFQDGDIDLTPSKAGRINTVY